MISMHNNGVNILKCNTIVGNNLPDYNKNNHIVIKIAILYNKKITILE